MPPFLHIAFAIKTFAYQRIPDLCIHGKKLTAHKLRMLIAENSSIDNESVSANYELTQAFKTWLKILNFKRKSKCFKNETFVFYGWFAHINMAKQFRSAKWH